MAPQLEPQVVFRPLNTPSFLIVHCSCLYLFLINIKTMPVPVLASPYLMIEYNIQTPLSPHWPMRLWKRWLLSQPHMDRQKAREGRACCMLQLSPGGMAAQWALALISGD